VSSRQLSRKGVLLVIPIRTHTQSPRECRPIRQESRL